MQSDAELVEAILGGEKEAFAALVARYERPVRAAALDVLGEQANAAWEQWYENSGQIEFTPDAELVPVPE